MGDGYDQAFLDEVCNWSRSPEVSRFLSELRLALQVAEKSTAACISLASLPRSEERDVQFIEAFEVLLSSLDLSIVGDFRSLLDSVQDEIYIGGSTDGT